MSHAAPPVRRRPWIPLLAIAAALTLLNAVEPLQMDDPFIYRVAEQITTSPADPYGFDIFWLQWPQPVFEELTPPVVPYWWAAGLVLFGDSVFLWKLWFFPFALLLVVATHALFRRFAPGWEIWGPAWIALSPAFLPGFNLMQDVPAVALGLSAIAIAMCAAERFSFPLAVASGVVAGLALQTKYTMVAALAVIAVHALLSRRIAIGVTAVSVAIGLFASWESWMTLTYGQGMFLGQVRFGLFWLPRSEMVLPLVRLVGATAPLVGLTILWALGLTPRVVYALAAMILASYLALTVIAAETMHAAVLGAIVFGTLAAGITRLLQDSLTDRSSPPAGRAIDHLLVTWLIIEIAVFFATAPFPAVRRVMGVVVVASFIAARLAARSERAGRRIPVMRVIVSTGMALALLFQATDFREARAQQQAVVDARDYILEEDPDPTIWFVGHWGFQHYAERAGMLPVVPDHSMLHEGDWLLVPSPVHRQEIVFGDADLASVATLSIKNIPSLTTGQGYYGGDLPIAHLPGPRLSTTVMRVRRDHLAESSWDAVLLADWAVRAGGRTAAAAVPALARRLLEDRPEARVRCARALAELGNRAEPAAAALILALDDRQPAVRFWSAVTLGKIGPRAGSAVPSLRRLVSDPDPEVREAAATALTRIGAEPAEPDADR